MAKKTDKQKMTEIKKYIGTLHRKADKERETKESYRKDRHAGPRSEVYAQEAQAAETAIREVIADLSRIVG